MLAQDYPLNQQDARPVTELPLTAPDAIQMVRTRSRAASRPSSSHPLLAEVFQHLPG